MDFFSFIPLKSQGRHLVSLKTQSLSMLKLTYQPGLKRGLFRQFQFLLDFLFNKFVNERWVHLNRPSTLLKALKNVESLLNGSQIKFELDETFAPLPYDVSFVPRQLDHIETI